MWILAFLLLSTGRVLAQEALQYQAAGLQDYPKMHALIVDSVKGKNSSYLLQVQWMDTTFQLDRRYGDFITDVPVPKGDNVHYSLYQEEPWDGDGFVMPHANCHSFGMGQSFRHEGINSLPWFNPTTFLDASMLEVLLSTAYQKQFTLDAASMKDLMKDLETGSLLVFRDSTGYALHTAFQGREGLLSKNGRYEPRIYHRLDYLKIVYHQTATIEVYRMEADRVKAYLEQHELQALWEK